ncbi:MAG: hypothetical protein GOVbin3264_8 [Prokaryotic dsDNA virus sp.]|nr:MAG: hypothetical protein GOVbin3264_8 [Prokaryotic dsDNA virus sp.]|tara:strand:- start:5225 stop:6073 length:849 start_codon:yes stop_codon:yes gene_type:complete
MNYKKGYKIKPKFTNVDGTVIFTDGTNEVQPNQKACEAYGYKYDVESGTCYAFQHTRLDKKFSNDTSIIKGSRNVLEGGVNNAIILGNNNTLEGNNSNCNITGSNHTIEQDARHTSILGGTYATTKRTGEVVLGGGGFGGSTSLAQTSIYHISNVSNGADVTLYCNYNTSGTEEILIPKNSICIYEIYITGLCFGGTSGTAGHYQARKLYGTLLCFEDGSFTHDAHSNEDITTSGTTGTISIDTGTAYTFSVQVAGQSNVSVQWNATVKLYINQTNRVSITP